MAKTRPRRSQARYPREQLPHVRYAWLHGPWRTRADRARALLQLIPFDPARQADLEATLEEAGRQGLDEDRVCQALCDGIKDYHRERIWSDRNVARQVLAERVEQIRRELPPLLVELRRLAENDQEAGSLIRALLVWLTHTRWESDGQGRRARPGNPFLAVIRQTRQRLTDAGVKHRDAQTLWLQSVGLLETSPAPK